MDGLRVHSVKSLLIGVVGVGWCWTMPLRRAWADGVGWDQSRRSSE